MARTGRPTKYKKEYCEKILQLPNRDQHSAGIATALGVSKQTIHEWASVYPDFSDAFKITQKNYEQYWLELAQSRAEGRHQGSDTLIKFMLSAACGYREKTDVVQQIEADISLSGKVEIDFCDMNPDEA